MRFPLSRARRGCADGAGAPAAPRPARGLRPAASAPAGRYSIAGARLRARRPRLEPERGRVAERCVATGPRTRARSTMTSPTSSTPLRMPSGEIRDGRAGRAEEQRDRRSVTTRLTSSGMRMSNERRPASTCASGGRAWPRQALPRASSWCRRRPASRPAGTPAPRARSRSASERSAPRVSPSRPRAAGRARPVRAPR